MDLSLSMYTHLHTPIKVRNPCNTNGLSPDFFNSVGMTPQHHWIPAGGSQDQAYAQYPREYYPRKREFIYLFLSNLPFLFSWPELQPWPNMDHQSYPYVRGGFQGSIPSSSSTQPVSVPPVPSSGGNDSSDGDYQPSFRPSLHTRRTTVADWLHRTAPQLTEAQIHIANHILGTRWWETESEEPELRANDELVVGGYISPGGSRFRAFLDEERGWRCTFDHNGAACTHGKGRQERAVGTIRSFFMYKPFPCGTQCGTRW